jgi:hypothetical protein
MHILHYFTALKECKDAMRASVNTLGLAVTQIAFKGSFCASTILDTTIGADHGTESATQTFVLINPYDAILRIFMNCSGGAVLLAGRFPTLIADFDRVRFQLR